MFDIKKLFAREARAQSEAGPAGTPTGTPDSDYQHPSALRGEGLELEYQSLIATQFRRWGIKSMGVTIEVRKIGQATDGFDVLVGMVRLTRWDRISSLRVMLGLPLLEHRVRKAVKATWLADYSHFGGLWLRASESLQAGEGMEELHQLLMQVAAPSQAAPAAPARARAAAVPRQQVL
ncbi:MAG: hypothetical protein V4864_23440 [Pseudomonadota bacterium]